MEIHYRPSSRQMLQKIVKQNTPRAVLAKTLHSDQILIQVCQMKNI